VDVGISRPEVRLPSFPAEDTGRRVRGNTAWTGGSGRLFTTRHVVL